MRNYHGMRDHPLYKTWKGMRFRCSPRYQKSHRYFDRGITCCTRWDLFENFVEDMGEKPEEHFTLDRIDNDDGYYPENCRWACPTTQARNTDIKSTITYQGETLRIAEWAERFDLTRIQITDRFIKLGWSAEKTFTTPVRQGNYGR